MTITGHSRVTIRDFNLISSLKHLFKLNAIFLSLHIQFALQFPLPRKTHEVHIQSSPRGKLSRRARRVSACPLSARNNSLCGGGLRPQPVLSPGRPASILPSEATVTASCGSLNAREDRRATFHLTRVWGRAFGSRVPRLPSAAPRGCAGHGPVTGRGPCVTKHGPAATPGDPPQLT